MTDDPRPDGSDETPPRAVEAAARLIASGDPIDWRAIEADTDDAARLLLRRLHDVEGIAAFHREWREPPASASTPDRWGHLTILEEIGRGSFGRVYRAFDPRLHREVALKILEHGPASDSPGLRTALDEGRHLARLRHPNVVVVHGADDVDGRVGLIMELVTGRTLADILHDQGPFSAEEAALVCRDVCRALAAVHRTGLVHRDVKAQNVIRERGGRHVLMDFGAGRVADVVASAGLSGTPLYLAPEVLAGASPSPASDLYSVGVLLYFLVTGAYPIAARTIDELREAHQQGTRQSLRDARPDLPAAFIHLVDRALAADPAHRISSAGRFETELTELLGHATSRATPPAPLSRSTIVMAGLLLASVVALVLWPRATPAPEPQASAAAHSIAVLPFVNAAGIAADEYFADGMTDELISSLGRIPGLRVAARTSAFSFKGQPTEVREVARRLGVGAVLEGTIRRSGPRLRVTAALVGAADGLQLWSATFDKADGDIFAVQDEITRGVVSGLSLQLGGTALLATRAGRTEDLVAHDLYLRGLAMTNSGTEPDLRRALEFYQEAVQRDPAFARAYSGIGFVHSMLADAYVPSNQAYAAARAAAAQAVAHDDLLAEAHAVLGYATFGVEWDPVQADPELERALELDPNNVTVLVFYSTYLCGFGREKDAMPLLDRATVVDPLSPLPIWALEFCRYITHRYDDVIDVHKRSEALAPGFWYLDHLAGAAHRELGQYALAVREYEKAAASAVGAPLYGLGLTYARMGRTADARLILARLNERAKTNYVPYVYRAALHGALGEMDEGVALLQKSFDVREILLIGANPKPELIELLRDPRARRIVEEANATWRRRAREQGPKR